MPMTPDELSELTVLIAAARKKPLNFGLCIGKKPDSMILYLHRKKAPEILARLAKKAGDTSKVAMGTVSVSGKKMMFTIIGDPPSGMKKRTKLFLTAIKKPFIVELLDESGTAIGDTESESVAESNEAVSGATSGAEGGEPSKEEIEAFKAAYATATKRYKQLTKLKVDTSALKLNLGAVAKLAKDKKISDAMFLLSGLGTKFAAAEQEYCDHKKQQARDAIDKVATYRGAALEIPKLESLFRGLEADCVKFPFNPKKIGLGVREITRKEKQLKRAGKKYEREYNKARATIKELCEDYLSDIAADIEPAEKDGFEKDIAAILQKLDEHSAKLALNMSNALFFRLGDAERRVRDGENYRILKNNVNQVLTSVYPNRAFGIEKDCLRLEAQEAEAKVLEDKKAYAEATVILTRVEAEASRLFPIAMLSKEFQPFLKTLKEQLLVIKTSLQFEFVIPDFNELMAGLKTTIAFADDREFEKAKNRAIDLTNMAKALEQKIAKAAPLTAFENGVETEDIDKLRQQAKDILANLKNHPRASLAPLMLAEVEEHVDALDSTWNQWVESAARDEMKTISDLANEAWAKLNSVDAFYGRAVLLAGKTAILGKTHAEAAYIRSTMVKIAAIVTKAKADALASADGIAKDLSEGERLLDLAQARADAKVLFRQHKTEIEASVTQLSSAEVSLVGKEKILADVQKQLEVAEGFSRLFKLKDAARTLEAIDTILMTANIGVSAKKGTPPSEKDIKALLSQPDGEKALDELVSSLPDSTQQDVMIRVLEVRFGMKVNVYSGIEKEDTAGAEKKGRSLDVPAPKLLLYYDVLKSVPATHTNLNPSLKRFDSVEEGSGGWYAGSEQRVVMELDDNIDDTMEDEIGDPKALDHIDPNSVCLELDEKDEPTLGSWTTFHEIGHAVDDRLSYMDKKAKDVDYGGWVEYGSNIAPIVRVVAAYFEYDPSYVERKMAGGKPKTPQVPSELQEKEGRKANIIWLERQKNFKKWLKAVSVDSAPWASASTVNTHKIDDVMYHEAYSNNWVSYMASARRKGVTGYQFRAPGEWFAELYAAYHTKKLNTSHPAEPWLARL